MGWASCDPLLGSKYWRQISAAVHPDMLLASKDLLGQLSEVLSGDLRNNGVGAVRYDAPTREDLAVYENVPFGEECLCLLQRGREASQLSRPELAYKFQRVDELPTNRPLAFWTIERCFGGKNTK